MSLVWPIFVASVMFLPSLIPYPLSCSFPSSVASSPSSSIPVDCWPLYSCQSCICWIRPLIESILVKSDLHPALVSASNCPHGYERVKWWVRPRFSNSGVRPIPIMTRSVQDQVVQMYYVSTLMHTEFRRKA